MLNVCLRWVTMYVEYFLIAGEDLPTENHWQNRWHDASSFDCQSTFIEIEGWSDPVLIECVPNAPQCTWIPFSLCIEMPVGYNNFLCLDSFSQVINILRCCLYICVWVLTVNISLYLIEFSWWETEHIPAPNGFCCTRAMCRSRCVECGWCPWRIIESLVVLYTVAVGRYMSQQTCRKREGNRYVYPRR